MAYFVIEADEVAQHLRAAGNVEAYLCSLIEPTRALARPPISNFRVAAVGMGSSGRVYVGVNLEFPGLPLSQSVHAEQFLVANMMQHGEAAAKCLVVSAAPCGHCRQFLQELRGAPDLQIVIVEHKQNGGDDSQLLSKFLPHRFGPHDLLAEDFPLLLERQHNRLRILHNMPGFGKIANGLCNGFHDEQLDASLLERLRSVALDAANRSYSPYSNCPSGIALLVKGGSVVAGSYCESAAYNPSLPPLQAALVAFVAGGGGGYEEIECALLVEKEAAPVQQAECTRMVLNKISPNCSFYFHYAAYHL